MAFSFALVTPSESSSRYHFKQYRGRAKVANAGRPDIDVSLPPCRVQSRKLLKALLKGAGVVKPGEQLLRAVPWALNLGRSLLAVLP